MATFKKRLTFFIFITAYCLYVVAELFLYDGNENLVGFITIGLILAMVLSILWRYTLEDEVQQKIADNATKVGFWATFVSLYIATLFEGFEEMIQSMVPFWSIPVITWVIGYSISMITYR